jgi:hypothetical protein
MSGCDYEFDGVKSSTDHKERKHQMKKIMSLMLGMSLVLGAASYAFAQDKTDDKSKKSDKKKGKGKKGSDKTASKT